MAPTEGRVARPERRWGCRRGTPEPALYGEWRACSAFPIQRRRRVPNLKSLAQVVFEILRSKRIGVLVWPFKVTWRHQSLDHSIVHSPFPIDGPLGTKRLSLTEIFNGECVAIVDMILTRPLNKGHSFWYQSISHNMAFYQGWKNLGFLKMIV